MENTLKLILLVCCFVSARASRVHVGIDFMKATEELKKLPRFWTNTGFAPPEPVESPGEFFESDDVNLNLEIIGSLPNRGIQNVRIHWVLNLLSITNYTTTHLPVFNFDRLDKFLWRLTTEYGLTPTIEFMTTLKFKQLISVIWEDFAYQLVTRNIGRYGVKAVTKWKFETWNEPDLKSYNLLDFTQQDYEEYLIGIRAGMQAAERQYNLNKAIKLRGPAGLFKDEENHKFCWGVLEKCNENLDKCPIDIISFHRKGNGNSAEEILYESIDLIDKFSQKFPNLTNFQYSNTEADPIKKWSEPRDFQSDSRYAAILVETVFEHWQAILNGQMKNLESISHDNSFLNFYPNFFTQRTLLARFQMNTTTPRHVQFIQKPVFSALGLMSNLARKGGSVNVLRNESLSFVITANNRPSKFFSCILIWSHVNVKHYSNKSRTFDIEIEDIPENDSSGKLLYFVEGIDNKRTNPSSVFERLGRPAFPNYNDFEAMREAQNPMILNEPAKFVNGKIVLGLQLMPPFVLSIRICSENVKRPRRVKNLRLRRINSEEIIIFWSEAFYYARCIKTYEIFFKYSDTEGFQRIETKHIPFLYHQLKHTIPGCFKVRSRDVFDRISEFSDEICYDGTKQLPK